ncbi:hypothetical protein [Alienimonas californiensis]|nr:hypothetical protein [Alienimonas californiensis]
MCVLFPLMIIFRQQGWWVLLGVCVVANYYVLIYRATIGNIRLDLMIRAKKLQHCMLDEGADQLVRDVTSDERPIHRKFALFLRPFALDRAVFSGSREQAGQLDHWSLESRLALGFRRSTIMISFSPVKESMHKVWGEKFASSAMCNTTVYDREFDKFKGMLLYDRPGQYQASMSEWFPTFRRLAHEAQVVFCLPIDASTDDQFSATLEELVYLSDQLSEKCVFIMPPDQDVWMWRPTGGGVWESSSVKLSEMWESAVKKLTVRGLTLPHFKDSEYGVNMFTMCDGVVRLVRVSPSQLSSPNDYLRRLGFGHTSSE